MQPKVWNLHVFIIGFDGRFPCALSDQAMQEERRLFYVGLPRKRLMYLIPTQPDCLRVF
jgi:superfamily I DNA/RNA helicase